MSKNLQTTNYHGAVVSNEMADALQKTAVGQELFRYERRGNQTILQARLPEIGRYVPTGEPDPDLEGKEYNIRVNMNYLVRGMVRAVMDKDGNIDPNKIDDLQKLCTGLNYGTFSPEEMPGKMEELITKLEIPSSQKREFELFLNANGIPMNGVPGVLFDPVAGPVGMMESEVTTTFLKYQEAINGNLGEEQQEYAKKFLPEYQNMLRSYQEMANMDPKKETRILFPMDCGTYTKLTNPFIKQNNAYREAHNKPTMKVDTKYIDMLDQQEVDGKIRAFNDHYLLSTDVELELPNEQGKLETKNYTLSLESTAPPAGSIIFRPEMERTGIGIYKNAQELEDYHRNKNLKEIPDIDICNSIKKAVVADPKEKYTQVLEMPKDRNYMRYYQLHSGKYAMGLSGKKLTEYTAKATASLLHIYDKKKDFDVDIPRAEAKKLQNSPGFKAVLRAAGEEKVRNVLKKGDVMELAGLIGGTEKRYALGDQAKEKLRQLGNSMNMNRKKPDPKWDELHNALTQGKMKDSEGVFKAVESFVKGKKSLKNDPVRQESVDLALDALSIVAAEGDEVAKARAQILVDRFNTVRGAKQQGDRGFVNLDDHAKKFQEEPQAEQQMGLNL